MSKQDDNRDHEVVVFSNSDKFAVVDPDVGKKIAEMRCSFIKKRNKMKQNQKK